MPRTYDKLVRDDIPEIIRENDETPETRRVDGDEYQNYLVVKLVEEAEEYAESRDPDELADVLEVVRAVREAQGVDTDELEAMRAEKAEDRGGFADGIVLERVKE